MPTPLSYRRAVQGLVALVLTVTAVPIRAAELPAEVTLRGVYDVSGLRADADLMLWLHGPTAEGLQSAVLRGAAQALGLLLPYLVPAQQELLRHLLRAYITEHMPGKPGVPHE